MTTPDPSLDALLDFLKRSRGIDFTGYKRASLERRFRRRLELVGCAGFGDYLDYLEVHPEEYEALFDTLLINVTEFFRDPPAWNALRDEVMPRVIDGKPPDEPLRVWCAGCSSGQEPYTVAMVLAEVLGVERYGARVKIYATDIDEPALEQARLGAYMSKEVASVPADLRERYFERSGPRLYFRKDLRRTVIFGRNNLVSDAPISRLDLLVCRNTLMYFNAETQSRILRHFNFALRDGGVMMLGRSETMIAHRDLFQPLDMRQRLFARAPRAAPLQLGVAGTTDGDEAELELSEDERASRDAAMELGPQPQVIVSRAGLLTFANLSARALFKVSLDDVGRPFQDLELSYRPAELRRPIEEALRERRRVAVGEVTHQPEQGTERWLDIAVVPLLAGSGPPLGATVLFEDITRFRTLQHESEAHQHELEQAYEELQSTIDELETTNEELQSANEELQTTNEELQSTNEELETMNEELHSANEELETMNDELRDRTGELNGVNDFLQAILTSLALAVVVVDREQRVQVWNDRAEDLWGLRQDEVADHSFLSLDIGLPTERLAPALRAVVAGASGSERLELEAVNRRGRKFMCATTVLPLRGPDGGAEGHARGAIVLIEDGAVNGGPTPGA
jgi:two-component system, chemotaxis family, CheB/CheR fusion protein